MTVQGTPQMIPALSRIWEACFGDSPDYIRFFMENPLSRLPVLCLAGGCCAGGRGLPSALCAGRAPGLLWIRGGRPSGD